MNTCKDNQKKIRFQIVCRKAYGAVLIRYEDGEEEWAEEQLIKDLMEAGLIKNEQKN